MIQVHYVVVFVVRPYGNGHQLLLAHRAPGRYMGGTWHVISGGIEPGETAWQAALREMREETGLAPEAFYRLSTITSFYRADTDSLNTAPMFCALVDKDAVATLCAEHTACDWVDVRDADARLIWPVDRQALEEVRSVILSGGPARDSLRIPTQPHARETA